MCVYGQLEEAVVQGWCSVEELAQYGFARAPVMANEAMCGQES